MSIFGLRGHCQISKWRNGLYLVFKDFKIIGYTLHMHDDAFLMEENTMNYEYDRLKK